MSGWDPGWPAPAGGANPQPEPNGLPGPAADLGTAEASWQTQGTGHADMAGRGWGGDGRAAGVSKCWVQGGGISKRLAPGLTRARLDLRATGSQYGLGQTQAQPGTKVGDEAVISVGQRAWM